MANKEINIAVVGDGLTGKTCLLMVYKDRNFVVDNEPPTVCDTYSLDYVRDDLYETYTIKLTDVCGQADYDNFLPVMFIGIDVFIVRYSVEKKDSYENVKLKWVNAIRSNRPAAKIILVGTKLDLRHAAGTKQGFVTYELGEKLQRHIKADYFCECSAKAIINVDKVFDAAIDSVIFSYCPPRQKRREKCKIL